VTEDVSVLCGSTFFGKDGRSLKSFKPADLGSCAGITYNAASALVVPNSTEEQIDGYALSLEQLAQASTDPSVIEDTNLRVSKLRGKVGSILIPYTTESQARWQTEVAEDGWRAVSSAAKGGVVPGSGLGLIRAVRDWIMTPGFYEETGVFGVGSGEELGIDVLTVSCGAILEGLVDSESLPVDANDFDTLRAFAEKGGLSNPSIYSVGKDLDAKTAFWLGDSRSEKEFAKQFESASVAGVYDPITVLTTALLGAASEACNFIETVAIITPSLPEQKNA
jgi:chaperonin GroEL (HSP60 family)